MNDPGDGSEFPTCQGRVLGWAMFAGGLALLAYAVVAIVGFIADVASRSTVIHFEGGSWIALPIAIVWLILAGVIAFGGGRVAEPGNPRRAFVSYLLRLSIALLAFAIILPLSTYWGAGALLESRGYRACPSEQLGLRSFSRSWHRVSDAGAAGEVDCPE